jgi:hypothetical protein
VQAAARQKKVGGTGGTALREKWEGNVIKASSAGWMCKIIVYMCFLRGGACTCDHLDAEKGDDEKIYRHTRSRGSQVPEQSILTVCKGTMDKN